ncbi:hypothetical protein QPM17_06455 [Marinobacter sp. TBZ242]|uniref:Uncharacterized protein n=1 Tax=Marinobacter azerbaijanicus TaxID=3050455 RepID=A0ABT7IAR2_9GAMM|nr:hypothetical protein [Marinobacter sp. TBZ242]MDL0430755.1 hypothetical protein [Marinobacter sp. TBZ242]
MEWVKLFGELVLSWPVVALVFIVVFHQPLLKVLDRFGNGSDSEAEIGPIKIRLGKIADEGESAVNQLNRINHVMAESRLLELEITSGAFRQMFTPEQQERMEKQINELRELTEPSR